MRRRPRRRSPAWAAAPLPHGFGSNRAGAVRSALGVLWLLDGGLQFQPFMYTHGFPRLLASVETGQPAWLRSMLAWGAGLAGAHLPVWNTLFALTQVALGVGILLRPTVKLALLASFGWVLVVWWFGEGLGQLLTGTASPLGGAPGAVLLYALLGLVVWPGDRPGGLVGPLGARLLWGVLWAGMASLWLLGPNSGKNATRDAIAAAPAGIGPVDSLQRHVAELASGKGHPIAVALATLSFAIGVAVVLNLRARWFLVLAISLSVGYWVIGQGLGGLATGSATDPNAAPLFILLAVAVSTALPGPAAARRRRLYAWTGRPNPFRRSPTAGSTSTASATSA